MSSLFGRPAPTRRGFPWPLVRVFVLALAGVIASGWALFRAYTFVHPPMVVPVPAGPSADLDAGEIPAPELQR